MAVRSLIPYNVQNHLRVICSQLYFGVVYIHENNCIVLTGHCWVKQGKRTKFPNARTVQWKLIESIGQFPGDTAVKLIIYQYIYATSLGFTCVKGSVTLRGLEMIYWFTLRRVRSLLSKVQTYTGGVAVCVWGGGGRSCHSGYVVTAVIDREHLEPSGSQSSWEGNNQEQWSPVTQRPAQAVFNIGRFKVCSQTTRDLSCLFNIGRLKVCSQTTRACRLSI